MVNMKKLISGALVVLIGLMSFSVAFAATSANSDFDVTGDTTALTIAHGQTVSGTLTIDNTNIAAGSPFDLSATGASGATLPAEFEVKFYEAGTEITTTSSILVTDTPLEITYTIKVDPNTAPTTAPHQTVELTVTETGSTSTPVNAATLSRIVDIPSDPSRVITEASFSESVVRSDATTTNSVTLTATVDNTGNENVVVSQTLGSLANAATENTYFDLGTLLLNWNNEKNLSVTGATITLPTTGTNSNTITPGSTQAFIITIPTAATDKYGLYTATLSLMDDATPATSKDTASVSIEIVDSYNDETLTINDGSKEGDFNDNSGDDNKTYPGDLIQLEDITIDNEVGEDIENVVVTVTIYNQANGEDVVEEYEFDDFDLRDSKDETFNYDFQLPFDIEEDTYVISYLVEAEGEVSGNQYSNRAYDTFEVEQDSRHLVIEDVNTGEYCPGDLATEFEVKIANIGTRDLDKDDEIQVRLKITSFNFDETMSWSKDFDKQESEKFDFLVDIPADASGSSLMEISVFHEGDEDSEDDGSKLSQTYTLSDNCIPIETAEETAEGTIAGLPSAEGTVGTASKYDLAVLNTGSSSATYTIEISGVSGWGTSRVEPAGEFNLAPGQLSNVYVYLTPGEAASESNSAVMTLKSGSNVVATKTLTMNVGKSSVSTYTNALLGSTFAELGESEDLITLLSLATILLVSFGTLYTAFQGKPARKNRGTKKERK